MDSFSVIEVLLDSLSVLVDDDQDLLGLCHLVDQGLPQLLEDLRVDLSVHVGVLKKAWGHNIEVHTRYLT